MHLLALINTDMPSPRLLRNNAGLRLPIKEGARPYRGSLISSPYSLQALRRKDMKVAVDGHM